MSLTSAELRVPEVGQVLNGKYHLERVLGEGVMGVVFRAVNVRLGHHVAVKVPRMIVLAEPSLRERFEREAKAAASLRHRNSARVLDVETSEEGVPYMVMELLHGHDLETELARVGQLPIGDAVAYVIQACLAMVEAHERGLVHRDLKPSNLFLASEPDGSVCLKVLDFGISKFQTENVSLTAPLAQVGTPLYMSPEQVRASAHLDQRTDIWSLGVILYESLAGHPPFNGTATGIGAAIVSDVPTPLREFRSDIPNGLLAAVSCALEKDPNKRFESMRDMIRALAPFSGMPVASDSPRGSYYGLQPVSSHPSGWERATGFNQGTQSALVTLPEPPNHRKRKLVYALLGLFASVALGVGISGWARWHGIEPEAPKVAARPAPDDRTPGPSRPGMFASELASPSATATASDAASEVVHAPPPSPSPARAPQRARSYAASPPAKSLTTSEPPAKSHAPAQGWDNESPLPPP